MLTIRAMSDGKGYSSRHLEHTDYYAEGERVTGQWLGRGAELLGLSGAVRAEDFESIRQGLDPKTQGFLRLRHSADRLAADGTTLARGRNLYDFTISAPKSVSVMAVVADDPRLIAAHQTAVGEALREMENHAASRVREGGANTDRTTGNLVVAVYHHDASRELDPQIHTHAVAANLTYDGTEGRWKALQATDIYERRAYLTEVYRNALAREVRSLGYTVEDRRDEKGRDSGFEIRGVSAELLTKFSQRSRQRDEAIDVFVEKNGRRPTDNEVAVLVRESRADKLAEISTAELRERQKARLTPSEEHGLREAKREGRAFARQMDSAEPSLEHAKDHIFERDSVARDYEVLTEALRHGRGCINIGEIKGVMMLQESAGGILRSGNEIATTESLQRERSMNAASADNRKPWTVNSDERPAALEVSLLKRIIVLPWTQFLYAEGGDDEVRLVFSTHDVTVRGAGLGPLLADVGAQRVTAINEPTRPDRFPSTAARFVREIVGRKAGEE